MWSSLAASLAAAVGVRAERARAPRILLRNAWQTVNIGDVAHPVGALTLIEKHLPDAEVRLWPSSVDRGVAEMLQRRFPKLVILKGADDVAAAFKACDFLLHGSGSGFVAAKDVARWRAETGKPYGVIGISFFAGANREQVDLLGGAKFAYFRDSASLAVARDAGVKCPVMAFGPDTAFGVTDLRDDASAVAFLKASGLEEGKYICCIPRYRYTPYWTIKRNVALDDRKQKRNEEMVEHDHAPLREAIAAVAARTGLKVLVCCEDLTQVELGKRVLVDPLPADVRGRVVWREKYWLTDEAVSVYARSAGLFGNEMHSPILCAANGVPAIVCRFTEQTTKGLMWRDIGLGDWLFDLDDPADVKRIVPAVLGIATDPAGAREKLARARETVGKLQGEQMATLSAALSA